MTRLVLVRHARPAASWQESPDPPLDALGTMQARAVAAHLEPRGPLGVVTSPLRRAVQTADPLARRWEAETRVEPAVGEVPSPVDDLVARGAWLREVLTRRWSEVDPWLHEWRTALHAALASLRHDAVIFTHFVAINATIGVAIGDDRLVCCSPGHASVTELEVRGDGGLALVAMPCAAAGVEGGGDGSRVDSPL